MADFEDMKKFAEENKENFDLEETLSEAKALFESALDVLRHKGAPHQDIMSAILTIKILTRIAKKPYREMLSSPEVVDLFMQVGKYPQTEDDPVAEYTQEELERAMLFNHVMNNLLHKSNSEVTAHGDTMGYKMYDKGVLMSIIRILSKFKELQMNDKTISSFTRVFFLVSTYRTGAGEELYRKDGVVLTGKILEDFLERVVDEAKAAHAEQGAAAGQGVPCVSEEQGRVFEDIIRMTYNMVLGPPNSELEAHVKNREDQFLNFNKLVHKVITLKCQNKQIATRLHQSVVNYLCSHCPLLMDPIFSPPIAGISDPALKPLPFYGVDCNVIKLILDDLNEYISEPKSETKPNQNIIPCLIFLTSTAREYRGVRKYLKGIVLPKDVDFHRRPEVGSTLRNKIIRYCVSPSREVNHCATNFLYVLCKENTSRLVKYMGLGNAAGFLMAKGNLTTSVALGTLKKSQKFAKDGDKYEKSDDESDTEEYKQIKSRINPVIGSVVEEKVNTELENMTEEQKMHEVHKLLLDFDKMMHQGVIQPAIPGPDGRPIPCDHLLEMRDKLEELSRRFNF